MHKKLITLISASLLLVVIIAGWSVTKYLGERTRLEIIKENEASITVLAVYLNAELRRIEGAVKAMAASPWITPALLTRKKIDIEHADSVLERYNTALDASVCYLLDKKGLVIASSNRNDSDSFLGKTYKFRQYFQEAIKGNSFSQFALGVTSLKRGFYASYPVRDDRNNNIIGVAVIKKDLDEMAEYMRKYARCFLIDPNGIIFLSSRPELGFKGLWQTDKDTEKKLLQSRQFGDTPFVPLMTQEVQDRSEIEFEGTSYLVSRKPINQDGWSIVLFAHTGKKTAYRIAGTIVTIFACFIIIIPLVVTFKTARSADIARNNMERFQNLADQAPFGLMLVDKRGNFEYVNTKFTTISGYNMDDIPDGKTWFKKAYPDEQKRREAIAAWKEDFRVYKPGEKTPRIFNIMCKDGTEKIINIVSAQLKTGEYLVTYEDITVQKRLEERLQKMSIVDELTGLYNRRGFFTLANRQLKVAERTKKDMLVFFADLDKMKHINDTLGHQEGDNALLDVASVLREVFRESDIIGRMGGDEFAILAIDANEEKKDILMRRLRAILDRYNMRENRKYDVSLSVGIAHYRSENPESIDELMARADKLMYEDKRSKQ